MNKLMTAVIAIALALTSVVAASECREAGDLGDVNCVRERIDTAKNSGGTPKLNNEEISFLLENINCKYDSAEGRELASESLRLLLAAYPYAN
jgi:hypothetical protein